MALSSWRCYQVEEGNFLWVSLRSQRHYPSPAHPINSQLELGETVSKNYRIDLPCPTWTIIHSLHFQGWEGTTQVNGNTVAALLLCFLISPFLPWSRCSGLRESDRPGKTWWKLLSRILANYANTNNGICFVSKEKGSLNWKFRGNFILLVQIMQSISKKL